MTGGNRFDDERRSPGRVTGGHRSDGAAMQAHGKVRDAAPDEGVPAGGAERTTNSKGCQSNIVVISFFVDGRGTLRRARVVLARHARGRVAPLGVRAVSLSRGRPRARHRDERLGARLGRRRCRFPEPGRRSPKRLDHARRRTSAFRAFPRAAVVRAAVQLARGFSRRRRAPDDDARGGVRRARPPLARAPRGRGFPGRAARPGGRAGALHGFARQSLRRQRRGGDVPPAPARVPRRGGRRGRGRGRALRRARRQTEPGGWGR